MSMKDDYIVSETQQLLDNRQIAIEELQDEITELYNNAELLKECDDNAGIEYLFDKIEDLYLSVNRKV